MQFKLELIQAMRGGHKAQTRRVKREGERLLTVDERVDKLLPRTGCVYDEKNGRVKYQVGRRYAINLPRGPGDKGRMGKAVGSYECVGLREERLQDISIADCLAEGFPITVRLPDWEVACYETQPDFYAFIALWDSLHLARIGERWADNPTVWVIEMGEFEWE